MDLSHIYLAVYDHVKNIFGQYFVKTQRCAVGFLLPEDIAVVRKEEKCTLYIYKLPKTVIKAH